MAARSSQSHAQSSQVATIRRAAAMVMIFATIITALVLRFGYQRQTAALDEASTELARVEQLLAREKADLEAVREGGPESTKARFARATQIAGTVPVKVDSVDFAVWFVGTAQEGITTPDVPPLGEPIIDPAYTGLKYYELSVTAAGPTAQLLGWIEAITSDRRYMLSAHAVNLSGLVSGESTVTMVIRVWEMDSPPLLPRDDE
jgi:hypothetical protein